MTVSAIVGSLRMLHPHSVEYQAATTHSIFSPEKSVLPEHPGLKIETWATHSIFVRAIFIFFETPVDEAPSATSELFGFERTGSISRQSAQEIADVAQAFGQEDDITMLTLQFAPA